MTATVTPSSGVTITSLTWSAKGLAELRRLVGPVLVSGPCTKERTVRHGGRVVVCLDGSKDAETVLPTAAALARSLDGRISLIHVVRPSRAPDLRPAGVDVLASGYLARVSGWLAPLPVDWEVLHGPDPLGTILAYAANADADALALNVHGDAGGKWSTVAAVATRSPVPVLVTRGRAPPPVAPPMPVPTLAHLARRRHRSWTPAAAALVIGIAATVVPLPYNRVTGSAIPAELVLTVRPNHDHGSFLLLLADVEPVTAIGAVRAWVDTDASVEHRAPGSDSQAARDDGRLRMRQSVRAATVVVAAALGVDVAAIHVDADTGDLGGPSAGLAFALAATDVLTEGDLTGGRVVAATGELSPSGDVLPVGRVAEKARAAAGAGAEVLIVPAANADEAAAAAPTLRVLGVSTYQEAIDQLRLLAP